MKTLKQLRAYLATLKTRASDKAGEINDGLDDAAIRTIETDHAAIAAEIRTVTLEINRREAAWETDETPAPVVPAVASVVALDGAAVTTRTLAVIDLAISAGHPELSRAAIESGISVEAFRAQLFDTMIAGQTKRQTQVRTNGLDAQETTRAAMTEAMSYGLGMPTPEAGPSEAARQFMGRGLIDMAAESINYRGGRISNARQIDEILTRASHSTSDFPAIFENALNKALEGRYALATPTFKAFARQRNFKDFRPHNSVSVGDFPMLQKVLETGEIKAGTFGEGKEATQAFSYARRIAISRQMLINDDLGAIADLLSSYGATVALFEEVTFYALAFNANLADGKAVFHADHSNLLAGGGSAISVDTISAGRAAMGKQKSIDGNPLLSNKPRFLLTGPDRSTDAEKIIASVTPATAASVNPFSGKLVPIETGQITGNAWHLIGDPQMGSNWRWGYLDGYEAPRIRMEEPFGTQGFGMSVEHDFGAGPVDSRFAYKNAGG